MTLNWFKDQLRRATDSTVPAISSNSKSQVDYNHLAGVAVWGTTIYGLTRVIGSCIKVKRGVFIGRIVNTRTTSNALKCQIVKMPSHSDMKPTTFDIYKGTTLYDDIIKQLKTGGSNSIYHIEYTQYLTTVPLRGQSKFTINNIA